MPKKKKTEQVIAVWTELKEKLMITITELKDIKTQTITKKMQTQLNNLQTQIASKEQAIINKRVRVDELRAKNTNLTSYDIQEDNDNPVVQQLIQLEQELATLYQEVNSLTQELAQKEEELAIKYPFWAQQRFIKLSEEMLTIKKELWQRNQMVSNDYQAPHWKEDEQKYLEQLKVSGEKYTRLEKKLEQIRNLLADKQLNKLQTLYQKGEI